MKGETGTGFNCPPTPLEVPSAREEGLITVGEGAATVVTTSLHLCDQNGQLVIRTWISNLGRTGFLLLTLTSENFMPTTLGIGVQWPAMGLERRWRLLKTYKLKLT